MEILFFGSLGERGQGRNSVRFLPLVFGTYLDCLYNQPLPELVWAVSVIMLRQENAHHRSNSNPQELCVVATLSPIAMDAACG